MCTACLCRPRVTGKLMQVEVVLKVKIRALYVRTIPDSFPSPNETFCMCPRAGVQDFSGYTEPRAKVLLKLRICTLSTHNLHRQHLCPLHISMGGKKKKKKKKKRWGGCLWMQFHVEYC